LDVFFKVFNDEDVRRGIQAEAAGEVQLPNEPASVNTSNFWKSSFIPEGSDWEHAAPECLLENQLRDAAIADELEFYFSVRDHNVSSVESGTDQNVPEDLVLPCLRELFG
jgi:hypothetical protein